ncbi:MAG: hypothetical protein K6E18_06395 [Lachnospiraceae bacterium]|nr:hypothetical protein [Lachnospiraceae bacterium]
MVELIVTFALLAIFLSVSTMCISHAVTFFYEQERRTTTYSVADIVLAELKKEIRTMQGSTQEGKGGYLRIRNGQASVSKNGAVYEGSGIEFLTSNINDTATAVRIDADGCDDILIDEDGKRAVPTADPSIPSYQADLEPGYLTMCYYSRFSETRDPYKGLFLNRIVPGSDAASSVYADIIGKDVVWHATERLPKQLYQNQKIGLLFSTEPQSTPEGERVEFVDVTVIVSEVAEDGSLKELYRKKRRIPVLNTVYYKNEPTMYSDVG